MIDTLYFFSFVLSSDPLGSDETDLPVFELAMGGVNCFSKLASLPPNDEMVPPFPSKTAE